MTRQQIDKVVSAAFPYVNIEKCTSPQPGTVQVTISLSGTPASTRACAIVKHVLDMCGPVGMIYVVDTITPPRFVPGKIDSLTIGDLTIPVDGFVYRDTKSPPAPKCNDRNECTKCGAPWPCEYHS